MELYIIFPHPVLIVCNSDCVGPIACIQKLYALQPSTCHYEISCSLCDVVRLEVTILVTNSYALDDQEHDFDQSMILFLGGPLNGHSIWPCMPVT